MKNNHINDSSIRINFIILIPLILKLHNLFCLVFVWGIFERVSLDFSTPMLKNEENEGHFAIGHSKLCPQFTTSVDEITACIDEIVLSAGGTRGARGSGGVSTFLVFHT